MEIGPLLFAGASIILGLLARSYLPGAAARVSIIALVLAVGLIGPQVFGRHWYYEGFGAGAILGELYGEIVGEAERQKSN